MNDWPADFGDAYERHWEDGEMLFQNTRLANADQLYGLSAECGLKRVMVKLGMRLNTLGSPEESAHRIHIDNLWDTFRGFANERVGAHYASCLPTENPFRDWSIHQRYAHRRHCTNDVVRTHRSGANAVRTLLRKADLDGRTS